MAARKSKHQQDRPDHPQTEPTTTEPPVQAQHQGGDERTHDAEQVECIPVGEIHLPDGPLDDAKVVGLAHSISMLGLLEYPTVDPVRNLIFGRHRVEAVRRLGWPTVPCRIRSWDHLRAELARIDENWMRRDLCILEKAEVAARRVEIVEALGQRRRPGGQPDPDTVSGPLRSTADLAADMGVSDRTLQRYLTIATIPKEVRDQIRGTWLAGSTRTLIGIAETPPERQAELVAELLEESEKDGPEMAGSAGTADLPMPPEPAPAEVETAIECQLADGPVAEGSKAAAPDGTLADPADEPVTPALNLVPVDNAEGEPLGRSAKEASARHPRYGKTSQRSRRATASTADTTKAPAATTEHTGSFEVEDEGVVRLTAPILGQVSRLEGRRPLRIFRGLGDGVRAALDKGIPCLLLPELAEDWVP